MAKFQASKREPMPRSRRRSSQFHVVAEHEEAARADERAQAAQDELEAFDDGNISDCGHATPPFIDGGMSPSRVLTGR
ncbi:MAG: hypothetical protein JOY70_05735 [Acidisphaera sp.]|nr:hypothetical protein [Acidisphaera sp.]MBV9813687.1 hypothetical protein [Acetobacteraceae bacterium]